MDALIGLQNMWGGLFAQSITHEPLSHSFGIQLRQQCENEYSNIPLKKKKSLEEGGLAEKQQQN